MARRPPLENRTARRALAPRKKPYVAARLARGIVLRYRRNKASAGTWDVKVAIAGGGWTKAIGSADDHEAADGVHVLDYFQAADKARRMARGSDADAGAPITVTAAVDQYERDLAARGGDTGNARRIRGHISASLGGKPVGLLTVAELARWRDGLLAGGTLERSSVRRICRSFAAALSLAAKRDPRIKNEGAWRHGLGGIADTFGTRNAQVLSDPQVHSLIAAAYAESAELGLYIEALANTGARPSQVSRLNVADLQDGAEPRLLMPCSRKGRGRRAITHKPVPIPPTLAAKLKASAAGRAATAPLLLRADGRRWQSGNLGDHLYGFAKAARAVGVIVTAYALRHSAIVRALLAGVPARIVAALCDTSITELEKTYSAFIADHADTIARRGLLAPPPTADNVVALPAGRKS